MTREFEYFGSEKQVKWAKDIVEEAFRRIDDTEKNWLERMTRTHEKTNIVEVCEKARACVVKNLEKFGYSAGEIIRLREKFYITGDMYIKKLLKIEA